MASRSSFLFWFHPKYRSELTVSRWSQSVCVHSSPQRISHQKATQRDTTLESSDWMLHKNRVSIFRVQIKWEGFVQYARRRMLFVCKI